MTDFVQECDLYLNERTGKYEYRAIRYGAAANVMHNIGLLNSDTVLDLGAGFTEFDYHIRTTLDWRGRYIPIDGSIDGTDLDEWFPPREYDFAVALEILEHLEQPHDLIYNLQRVTNKAIIVTVPNPRTTDVLGMDRTHVSIITQEMLERWGFEVEERMHYGGAFSNGEPDSLFGVWKK